MTKTTILLVILSLLYQAFAAPEEAAAAEPTAEAAAADAAAEPAADAAAKPAKPLKLKKKAMEVLDKTDTVIVAKLTAHADALAPEAPVEVEGFPVDKALMADADVTEVLTLLRERNCKKFKRTLLALMVNKKVV